MASGSGKKRKGTSSGGRSDHGRPNWTPYLIALGVLALAAALYSVPKGQSSEGAKPKPSVPRKSVAELELQVKQMVAGLSGVAAKGDTGIFKKIRAISDQAKAVLSNAAAAGSDEERRAILEEGLAMKADWLSVLHDHTKTMQEEDAREAQDHAPFVPLASGHVTPLTEDNFTSFLASNKRVMVEFYAPWCPHCKRLAPEYDSCAKELAGRAAFAIVDGSSEKRLGRIFNVTGYPTLKWFVRGRPIDYNGPRTAARITSFVEERLQPAFAEVDSAAEAAGALDQFGSDKDLKVCVGEGQKESEAFSAFEAAAEHFRGQLVFVWAPSASESTTLHRSGSKLAEQCGAAGPCRTADEVIAWLDDRLSFDPDLADDA